MRCLGKHSKCYCICDRFICNLHQTIQVSSILLSSAKVMDFKAKFLCVGGLAAIDFYILYVGCGFFLAVVFFWLWFYFSLVQKICNSPHDLFFFFFFPDL